MKSSSALRVIMTATLLAAAAPNAHAATLVLDQAAFNADTTGQVTSNFDSYGVTGANFVGYTSVNAGTATIVGTAGQSINVNGPAYAASNGHDFVSNIYQGPDYTNPYTFTISLSSNVTAFGLDFGTAASGDTVSFSLNNGATSHTTTSQSFFDGMEFAGFVSDTPFNTITLSVNGPDGLGIEDITTAVSAVPLPASLPMFGVALGILGIFASRKNLKIGKDQA